MSQFFQPDQPLPAPKQFQPALAPQLNLPKPITPGSLIIFHYMLWKNDPTPVVIVSRVIPGGVIKGVNLHYLSFPYVKRVLGLSNPSFSYYNIKADQYISGAFRSYSWRGIDFSSIRVLDTQFLLQTMKMVTSFDPVQIRAMRQQIEMQLSQQVNQPQAGPSGPVPFGNIEGS